ncbi:BLOC-2 complex member HPS6 [Brachionichthys hirsutus]|uniref:BLOC-2 complex member HPS6 n=1 Tax=Brachionichthys hirsutus TaxID=412623 RepID=UPI003604B024
MARWLLEQLSDFRDYSGGGDLSEVFNASAQDLGCVLSNVRVSPEGRHFHVLLRKPQVGLVTFDQVVQSQKKLDLCLRRAVPVVDVLYLEPSSSGEEASVAVVVYEDGKAEFWRFTACKGGWRLLYASDLCNGPRARVVSVCACSSLIIWCEERPPSGSAAPPGAAAARSNLTYCVCRREVDVREAIVSLGAVKIALHNNPKFMVVGSGERVYLLPDSGAPPLLSVSGLFLSWSPLDESFAVNATSRSAPLKRLSSKESDFKRLLTDCLGCLSALEPPEIRSFAPTGGGGLLLLLATRWVCLLQEGGTLRRVYKLADNCSVKPGARASVCLYGDTLALLIGRSLHLVDARCGRELQKIALGGEGLLYVNRADRRTPHVLSGGGLFVAVDKEAESGDREPSNESVHSGARLVEAVFEEACKYYQRRSLSRTQLTVDALKRGGRFQAPASLASILGSYLSKGSQRNGGAAFIAGQDKLTGSLEVELKVLVALEEVKRRLVRASEEEVGGLCESLVGNELARLLASPGLDKEALLYLNFIFSVFPRQAWGAAQAALQLQHDGDASLSSGVPPDVWRSVLGGAAASGASPPSTNGRQKHGLRADQAAVCRPQGPARPAALPVFELLCESVLRFRPDLLPRFLELAQQQRQASSSWSFSGDRGGGGGGGGGAEKNMPLYKRALYVLYNLSPDADRHRDLEVELLLVSGRPTAVLQALRILMATRRWGRVTQVAREFCGKSPLLHKEIFTTLLCEVTQNRDLDPYLGLLWELCPDDFTVTTVLNAVLKNLPSPNDAPSPASCSSSCCPCPPSPPPPPPFADSPSSQVTVGLLKPLLRKVLQREPKPNRCYADILQSPSSPLPPPPPVPPRQPTERSGSVTDSAPDDIAASLPAETPGQQTPAQTIIPRTSVELPASPV